MADPQSTSRSAPWQPVLAGAALFVVAGVHLVTALSFLFDLSDWQGIKASLPDWQSIGPHLASATAEEVYEWLLLSATVFATLGVVYLLLGILLWRGVSRHGVRLNSTIFVVVGWLGSLMLLLTPDGGGTGTGPGFNALVTLVLTVNLIAVAFLWFGAGARWVREN